jgi:formylmethanofuran dehydrogenase subunit C
MSACVVLRLRAALTERVEVAGVTADRCAACSEYEIAALPAWFGSTQVRLGDLFDVRGGRADHVVLQGDLRLVDGLGEETAGGELVIEGDAGGRVAAGIRGGRVVVHGDVGDDAGLAMRGGVLRVMGAAGDRLGAAGPGAAKGMTGGEIVVTGHAGRETAAHARRGLVAVGGEVGSDAARAMMAGTLVVLGRAGLVGLGSKRGSVIAAGGVIVPETYRYACTYAPTFVRLVLTHLGRRHGLAVAERVLEGPYRRHCGDAGPPGKGEILELAAETRCTES